jgi:hypothetical protein
VTQVTKCFALTKKLATTFVSKKVHLMMFEKEVSVKAKSTINFEADFQPTFEKFTEQSSKF